MFGDAQFFKTWETSTRFYGSQRVGGGVGVGCHVMLRLEVLVVADVVDVVVNKDNPTYIQTNAVN